MIYSPFKFPIGRTGGSYVSRLNCSMCIVGDGGGGTAKPTKSEGYLGSGSMFASMSNIPIPKSYTNLKIRSAAMQG